MVSLFTRFGVPSFSYSRDGKGDPKFTNGVGLSTYDFLFSFNSNCVSILYHFHEMVSYLSKTAIFPKPCVCGTWWNTGLWWTDGHWAIAYATLCIFVTGSIARSANLPVFSLLRGRFWGFSPRRGDTLHRWCETLVQRQGCRTPKSWNFYSDLTEIWNINAPQVRIPCAIFTKFADFVYHFRMRWVLKLGWICSRGCGVMGVLPVPKFPKWPIMCLVGR